MARVNQPGSQIKLTNVSMVRLKKGKKRFEIACYQNKVQDYRSGIEKDIDEVLQIHQVFLNVSKGQSASHEDLMSSFGTTDQDTIILEILKKGEIQLSEKERQLQIQQQAAEVLQIISTKCINPKSKKRYPPSMIGKALNELKFNITSTGVPAKVKALEAIKVLVQAQIIPIARAKMKIKITLNLDDAQTLVEFQDDYFRKRLLAKIIEESNDGTWIVIALIDPEYYREILEIMNIDSTKIKLNNKGSVEVLDMAVIDDSNA